MARPGKYCDAILMTNNGSARPSIAEKENSGLTQTGCAKARSIAGILKLSNIGHRAIPIMTVSTMLYRGQSRFMMT